jgi:hypothetical protein
MAGLIVAKKGVTVDASGMKRHIELAAKILNLDSRIICRDVARGFCGDMLDYTPPFAGKTPAYGKGRDLDAYKKGERAVFKDINKIFKGIKQMTGPQVSSLDDPRIFAFWKKTQGVAKLFTFTDFKKYVPPSGSKPEFIEKGDTDAFRIIHKNITGKSHSVPKGNKTVAFVESVKDRKKYAESVADRVGKLKAGWYGTSLMIPGPKLSRVGAWIKKQTTVMSARMMIEEFSQNQNAITVGNFIGNSNQIITKGGWLKMAFNHRAYQLREKIAYHVNWKLKKAKYLAAFERLSADKNYEVL